MRIVRSGAKLHNGHSVRLVLWERAVRWKVAERVHAGLGSRGTDGWLHTRWLGSFLFVGRARARDVGVCSFRYIRCFFNPSAPTVKIIPSQEACPHVDKGGTSESCERGHDVCNTSDCAFERRANGKGVSLGNGACQRCMACSEQMYARHAFGDECWGRCGA